MGVRDSLAQLDPCFRDVVEQEFAAVQQGANEAIEADKLGSRYELEDIAAVAGELALIDPYYELLTDVAVQIKEETGREVVPGVTFYPRQLDRVQWSDLLSGYELSGGERSQGLRCTWENYAPLTYPQGTQQRSAINREPSQANPWGAALTLQSDTPPLVRINAEGWLGVEAEMTLGILQALKDKRPNEINWAGLTGKELLIAQFSPTLDIYCAMQWARLSRQENPLDARYDNNRTYLRERVAVALGLRMITGYFHRGNQMVYSSPQKASASPTPHAGIRLTVAAEDLGTAE